MSKLHLAKGSEIPPLVKGKLRLYSMEYCPYAQRVRLVLIVKNIPHDIVNVHLKNKPDWIFDLHPEGKVPALDTGKRVVVESLDVADFLDEEYPEPPLYPADPKTKEADKALIKDFDALIKLYFQASWKREKSLGEYLEDMKPDLLKLEEELKRRGTYFGGEKPGMVDYMIWPWAERVQGLRMLYEEPLCVKTDLFSRLVAWHKVMLTQEAVKRTKNEPQKYYKLTLAYTTPGATVDYDNV